MFPEFAIDLSKKQEFVRNKYDFKLRTWDEHMKELKDKNSEFDLLIVGGGCNGAGVALEAASWGLKVALIDA